MANLLYISHQWKHVDILQQQLQQDMHKQWFLQLNPNAKIPVAELDDGRTLWESNAILNGLAAGAAYLPDDKFLLAQVL